MLAYTEFLFGFLARSFGFPLPIKPLHSNDWDQLEGKNVEARANRFFQNNLDDIKSWETQVARATREARLARRADLALTLAREAKVLMPDDISARYTVEDKLYAEGDLQGDIFHIKINHGFWEQYFVVSADGYDHELMRPVTKTPYLDGYVTSGFVDALNTAVVDVMNIEEGIACFQPIDFGFSFNAGGMRQADFVRNMGDAPVRSLISRGVFAGNQIWLREITDGIQRAAFMDGSFAKMNLFNGNLARILRMTSEVSDEVIFAVPPHLKQVLLRDCAPEKQSVLMVSGVLVHHSWPLMLDAVGNRILARLAEGKTVTVLVQAAVFSALLGLYIYLAKRALGLKGRIYFLDLGQALDVASPETAGQWVRNVQEKHPENEIADNPFTVRG